MARTVPATYAAPNPSAFSAGQTINTTNTTPFVTGQNYLFATGRCQPPIVQGWQDDIFLHTTADGAAKDQCVWRIPEISDRHTTVDVAIRASAVAQAGTAVVTARNATADGAGTPSVSFVVAAGTSNAWTAYQSLDVTYTGNGTGRPSGGAVPADVEQIEMTTALAAGGTSFTVHEVSIIFTDISGPLGAGKSGNFVPQDDTEVGSIDDAYSPFLVRNFRANITELRLRPRCYLNWSAAVGISAIADIGTAYKRGWTQGNPGLSSRRTLTYHILMGDPANLVDQTVYLAHGNARTAAVDGPNVTAITAAAAGGTVWKTGTVVLGLTPDYMGDFQGSPLPAITHIDLDTRTAAVGGARHVFAASIWGS